MSSPCPEIQAIDAAQKRTLPPFRPGDSVKVHYRIREGDKERIQVFQGVVLRKRSGGAGATFTVRKMSYGVGVERIFPVHSPRIERLEIVSRAHVRRARLYYLRDLTGKAARLRQSKKLSGDLSRLVQIDPTEKKTKRKRGKKRKAAAKAKKAG